MKSVVVEEFGSADQLRLVESPRPEVGPEDVLVRVAGAGLNWIDVSLRAGRLAHAGLLVPATRYGMGWDVAGVVEAIGSKVTGHRVGGAVIGLRDVLGQPGTHADYVVLHQDAVTAAPVGADLVEAAGLPLAGVTALGALNAAELDEGTSLLVTGAGGVIGRISVAVAVNRGVTVLAAGRATDEPHLTGLGATFIDVDAVRGESLASRVRAVIPTGVNAVIDTANLGAAAHEALRGAGTLVALVRPFAPLPLRGTKVVVHEAWSSPDVLAELVALVEAGVIAIPKAVPYPLDAAAEAHAAMEAGGQRGRLVLVP
jgi:NADPH:quinone reductase